MMALASDHLELAARLGSRHRRRRPPLPRRARRNRWRAGRLGGGRGRGRARSEEHTSELQSRPHLVCRLLHEKKNRSIILPPQQVVGYSQTVKFPVRRVITEHHLTLAILVRMHIPSEIDQHSDIYEPSHDDKP